MLSNHGRWRAGVGHAPGHRKPGERRVRGVAPPLLAAGALSEALHRQNLCAEKTQAPDVFSGILVSNVLQAILGNAY